jgi:hypothetical protein
VLFYVFCFSVDWAVWLAELRLVKVTIAADFPEAWRLAVTMAFRLNYSGVALIAYCSIPLFYFVTYVPLFSYGLY